MDTTAIKSALKYYRREPNCPYEYGTKENFFWHSEKEYLTNSESDPEFHSCWVNQAEQYIQKHQEEHNPITDPAVPVEQKAIILFTDAMLEKWRPQDNDWILEY